MSDGVTSQVRCWGSLSSMGVLCERSGNPSSGLSKAAWGQCAGRRWVRLAGASVAGLGGRDLDIATCRMGVVVQRGPAPQRARRPDSRRGRDRLPTVLSVRPERPDETNPTSTRQIQADSVRRGRSPLLATILTSWCRRRTLVWGRLGMTPEGT